MEGDLAMRRPCVGTGTSPVGAGQELLSKRSLYWGSFVTDFFSECRRGGVMLMQLSLMVKFG